MIKRKNKKGFTLIELLAVIVILAIIMVLAVTSVFLYTKEAKQHSLNVVGETMRKYLRDNYKLCKLNNKDAYSYDDILFTTDCILNEEIDTSYYLIKNSGYSQKDIKKVYISEDGRGIFGLYLVPETDGHFSGLDNILINPTPNKPDLTTGLVPVKYDGSNWVITTHDDFEWFDYNNQMWANSVILKDKTKGVGDTIIVDIEKTPNKTLEELDIYAMFVWVPRYSYTIGCHDENKCYGYRLNDGTDSGDPTTELPGAIDIKFVPNYVSEDPGVGEEDAVYPTYDYTSLNKREPDNWYTHPAFTLGNEELSGIWVGKFEVTGDATNPTVLPNVYALTHQTVNDQFLTAKKFGETMYELTTRVDSHMMKNSEWGAVAYLSQSIYGKYGNKNYSGTNKEIYKNDSGSDLGSYTGRSQGYAPANSASGQYGSYKYDDIKINADGSSGEIVPNSGTGASTTGNIYGIYDMSGGKVEHVMGNYKDIVSQSNFEYNEEDKKYYDKFTSNNLFNEKAKESTGHALYEIKGWYKDTNNQISDSYSWIRRGGYFASAEVAGIFSVGAGAGNSNKNYSFRVVISNNNN